jgi:hypothetical protein
MKDLALVLAAITLVGCMGNKAEPPYITPQSSIYGASKVALTGKCVPVNKSEGMASTCVR